MCQTLMVYIYHETIHHVIFKHAAIHVFDFDVFYFNFSSGNGIASGMMGREAVRQEHPAEWADVLKVYVLLAIELFHSLWSRFPSLPGNRPHNYFVLYFNSQIFLNSGQMWAGLQNLHKSLPLGLSPIGMPHNEV